MMDIQELKNTFNKQMKKQRYDNSGRKDVFIKINEELFRIVEKQQKEIEELLKELHEAHADLGEIW